MANEYGPQSDAKAKAKATLDFLQQDYYQKIQYLKDHFTRLWNRFNYFLTVQSALFGATVLSPDKFRWWVPIFAAVVCLLWYMFGVQDRYLVELYRKQIERSLEKIEGQLFLGNDYYMVGQTEDRNEATIKTLGIQNEIYQRRWAYFSTTKLPALFPLFLLVIWVGVLIGLILTR